jgi:signal transduction histidine kinase
MWFRVQIAAYVSLILGYGLVLLLAVRRRLGHGRAQRWLEVTLSLAGLWVLLLGALATFLSGTWRGFLWARAAHMGLVILAILTAEFAAAYVRRSGRRWPWLVLGSLPLLAAIVLDLFPVPLPASLFPGVSMAEQRAALAGLILLLAWAGFTGSAWWIGWTALSRATGSKHRNRVRYLLVALVCFAVGDSLVFIGGVPDVYVGLAARLLGFTLVTVALFRYDLPDVKRLAMTGLCYVLLSGFTALLYLAVLLALGTGFGVLASLPRLARLAPAFVLGLMVTAGVDVLLRPRLQHLLASSFLGQDYDVQKGLRVYSQQINLILDLERLADATLDWLQTTMGVQRLAFVLITPRSDEWLELEVTQAIDVPLPAPMTFHTDSRFMLHFRNMRCPLSQYDLDMLTWFQSMPPAEREWLRGLAIDLYVPVLVADKPEALLALGPKRGGRPYSSQDMEALMILAGQTGTALENARLMSDLRAVQDDLHHVGTQLAETNQQLKRLDQTKTDFITIASHELRTPLTQIYGYTDILTRLKADDLSDAQALRQFIEGITRGAARLKRVVDAMVDVSLIETGSLRIHPVTLPLGMVVQSAVETVQDAAQERCLTFVVDDLVDLPYIQADSARLEQALVSVLFNAVKFTPDGGTIAISGRHTSTPSQDSYVELQVQDSGIGIDPAERELIFEKFHRAEDLLHHSTDDVGFKGAGPGLGLSIVKGIVEAHGGRIWAESSGRDEERCPGSTFYIRLPVNGPRQEREHA